MRRHLLLTLLALAAVVAARATETDSLLLRRQQHFARFAEGFPQERVYLHFDNTSYYKGEQLWYKAYVVRDASLHPTDLSRILYVELLSPIGFPVETQKLLIENGQAHGSFQLKDTLGAGFYEVRAYTTWMLNFTTGDPHGWHRLHDTSARRRYGDRFQRYLEGNAGIFSRVFPVYERVADGHYEQRRMPRQQKATATLIDTPKDRMQIDFYPEGGNLVRDVPTRIAFQAHNTEGRTLNVAGALYRRGDSIGYFSSVYAGRGLFTVTADSLDADELTEGLQLKVTYQGRDYRFPLPRAQKRGVSLSVVGSGDRQLHVTAARNAQTPGEALGLSITSRGRTLYYAMADLRSALQASATIGTETLQTGVNIVTLFNTEGRVLAQRQVFVNNHDRDGYRLQPLKTLKTLQTLKTLKTLPQPLPEREGGSHSQGGMAAEKLSAPLPHREGLGESLEGLGESLEGQGEGLLSPYQKIALDYQLVDGAGQPVREAHDFSVAVTDGDSREQTYDDATALTYLLLGSEVKGFIPHAAYYFEADDAEHRQALDLLLMVQGWTRYDYEQMLSGQTFEPMLPVERGLSFSGRLWDDKDYTSRRFWKLQNKKPYWVYSELAFDGDTMQLPTAEGRLAFPDAGLLRRQRRAQQFLTGESRVDSAGTFHLNIQPFYGKGRLALVINKRPLSELGLAKGGIGAHNFQWNTVRRPGFLLGKRIEPLNQYSPLPKNYDYYETANAVDPFERDMFRRGYMTVPRDPTGRLIYYDAVSQTYMLPEVQKLKRRRWSDFRDISPVCVMDVREMMAWLSNIYGDIQDFKFRDNNPYGDRAEGAADDIMTQWMYDDARWLDEEFGTHAYTQYLNNSLNGRRHDYDIETSQHYYARLSELLYIFGLDGMNSTYINAYADGGEPFYTFATGDSTLLPRNLHFFPVNENFRTLQLYADAYNRQLTHQRGRYHEAVFGYDPSGTTNNDHPLTSIFNFVTDDTYSNAHPLPEFLGYRINFQGFSRPAEFFCPDYDWEPEPDETDYRRTVYWNPQARTGDDGRVHLEFFNNGFSRRLSVTAEGVTPTGVAITAGQ